MSSLIAPRPPQWRRMHSDEDRQGSLFGGEAFQPPPPRRPALPREEAAPGPAARASREDVVTPRDGAAAPPREFVAPPEAGEIRVSRGAATPLAGPTLDDVVTHAWEGLVAGVPAACPVCHGELEPALGGALRGHCGTCGITLD
jgi:hypothetical protein